MPSRQSVKHFLSRFHSKMRSPGVVYINRFKHFQSLLEMNLDVPERRRILEQIQPEDFCSGPQDELMYGFGNMWVFGKKTGSHEIYIKLAEGLPENRAICISFHRADFPLDYPFKK